MGQTTLNGTGAGLIIRKCQDARRRIASPRPHPNDTAWARQIIDDIEAIAATILNTESAAPALLAACEDVVGLATYGRELVKGERAALDEMHAAIAAARPEARDAD